VPDLAIENSGWLEQMKERGEKDGVVKKPRHCCLMDEVQDVPKVSRPARVFEAC
jgi:hypothetical protein